MTRLLPNRRWMLPALLLALIPFCDVQACGPDFRPDIFVRPLRPDDFASFARGQLEILQPTYFRRDLIVAYRYLIGGKLSPAEEANYAPASKVLTQAQAEQQEAAQPANQWIATRAKYPNAPQVKPPNPWDSIQTRPFPDADGANRYIGDFLNCPDDAFTTAVVTLKARAKTFGSPSPVFSDWLGGQDAVFSNCTGKTPAMPAAVAAASPRLLRADREYQIAAANFYALRWSEAQRQFEAIAKDEASPWQVYGGYLAARAMVRQAFFAKPLNNDGQLASFDAVLMAEAQKRLEALLRDPAQAKMRHAIQAELNFVRLRTEPAKRMQELAAALAGPKADPNFNQDLLDLTFALDQRLDQTNLRSDYASYNASDNLPALQGKAYVQTVDLQKTSPLVDWLLTFQSPSEDAHQHALQMWAANKSLPQSLPWLTAAIAKAAAKDDAAASLLNAAAQLPKSSPAYMMVTFHRARLLIALNRQDEARILLEEVLPEIRKSGSDSATNAFLGLRMQAARNLGEFLTYAPRKLLDISSQASFLVKDCAPGTPVTNGPCPTNIPPLQFDTDSATALNFDFPLDLLIQSSQSPELPESLRQSVAMTAWVRSVQLGDAAAAAQLAPLLPKSVEETAGKSIDFPATLAMLRNPGMRPYLDAGVQRSLTYNIRDEYRDNWWCADWSKSWTEEGPPRSTPRPTPAGGFPTQADAKQAEEQTQRLLAIELPGSVYLGQRAIAYATSHPDDPDVAEALFLTVRATHFGCSRDASEAKRLATAKEAFQLLKRRYPNSKWAKMTKYYS